ncbi:hypothetical protein F0562_023372 [Nyssa sinensis]|uniref:Protein DETOXIFICATION n=1 Tax=Nyssa sinensis TaxID=561372 RepID=A0A5J5BIY2_9ASTE|nr:hypothetical protein F0562_023372 [Nyssa sinensis]
MRDMNQEDSNPLLESPLIAASSEKDLGYGRKLTQNWCDITEIIAELRKQLQLAGPLVLVSFLQYSFQMISVMFVGHLGELSLSGASMATSFAGVTGLGFMCSSYVSNSDHLSPAITQIQWSLESPLVLAAHTRVSNELGAGQPSAARLAARVVIFLAIVEGLLLSLVSVMVRGKWGYLYTNEEEVVKYMASIMPVLATSNFMDGIQAGLWMGIISGSGLQALLLLAITMRTDWEHQAMKARDRVHALRLRTEMAS